jgi:hypothetical protein
MNTTATLIDNIMTNNLEARMETGLVTVRVSDLPPICLFRGVRWYRGVCNGDGGAPKDSLARRVVIGGHIWQFSRKLEEWDWRGESNVAQFRNGFWDIYDGSFLVEQGKRKRLDEKLWLDDLGFKQVVREKGDLYSKKLKGKLGEGEWERLAKLIREVNSTRQRIKRAHFGQRLNVVMGICGLPGVSWGRHWGRKKGRSGTACGYFKKDWVELTDI